MAEVPELKLPLDETSNEHLRIGYLMSLVQDVLNDCPDMEVAWRDGIFRISYDDVYYALGAPGCKLQASVAVDLFAVVLAFRRRREFKEYANAHR